MSLRRRDGSTVEKAAIAAVQEGFAGELIAPGDAGYDAARRIWNCDASTAARADRPLRRRRRRGRAP